MTSTDFYILGPLEVVSGTLRAELQAGKERSLLAFLLTEAGRVVSIDRLIDELWGEEPPSSAHASLRVLVSRLRKALASIGVEGAIDTRAPGYVLNVEHRQIDSFRFEELAARGRRELTDGNAVAAANTLGEALELWRGPALADAAECRSALAEAARLEEVRLVALEDRINADMECGRHDVLVGELEKLIASHPLRERLWRSMILALYRSGRQTEALAAYQKLRSALVDEMGVEPSASLSELQKAILNRSADLDWTPPVAQRMFAAEAGLPAGVVTFLLTDVEGSASMWDADADAASRAIERHEKLIAAAVSDHGGTLIKSKGEGDSSLAVFRRASNAAAAAIDIQRTIAAEEWPPNAVIRLRISLHTGEAELRDGDYYGRTLNRAARLRALARGGQMVCSRATGDLIADDLPDGARLLDLGTYELAGMSRPEHVLEIVDGADDPAPVLPHAAAADAGLPPQLEVGPTAQFVGRGLERKRLEQAWEQVLQGHRRAVLLAGEPGIGKTRLAAEFARDVHAAGATVLFGGCDEELVSSYQPFIESLRTLAMTCSPDVLLQGSGLVAAGIARLVPEVRARVGKLPELAGEPESDRRLLFDAVNSLIVGAAKANPILIVLDDLHWADQGSLLLLRYLARHAEAGALMIVGTYRDVEIHPSHPLVDLLVDLRRTGVSERISLGGLSSEEIAAMLAARASHDLNPAALAFVEVLKRETEGNPFFIEELVSHLTEVGVVYRSGDRWTSNLSIDEVGIPEGIRDVVGRRLARLPDDAKEILTLAAVMGKEFRADALEVIGGLSEDALLGALDHAKDSGLIRELPQAVGRYAFRHSLVRDALYQGLSTLRRARLHRRVGEALEGVYGTRASAHLSELSHHFLEAAHGDATKAISYTVAAGDHALSQLAYEEAAKHYERALDVMEGVADADPQKRAEILLGLGEARWRAGDGASRGSFHEALEIARALPDAEILARASLGLTGSGGLTRVVRTDEGQIRLLEEASSALPETNTALRARVLARLADELYYTLDSERKMALAQEAVAIAESVGDASAILVGHYSRVWAAMGPDTPLAQLLSWLADVIRLASETGNRELAFEARLLRGQLRVEGGDVENAESEITAASEIAEELRIPTFFPWISAYRSLRAYLAGRFDEADRLIQDAVTAAAAEGIDPEVVALTFGGQSMVQLLNRRQLGDIVPVLEEWAPKYPAHPVIRCTLAFALSDAGDVEATKRVLAPLSANGFDDLPRSASWTTCMWMLAHAASFTGDAVLSATLYEMLAPSADRMIVNPGLWICFGPVATVLGELAGVTGRLEEAESHFTAALGQAERIGAGPFVADICFRYASTMSRHGRPRDPGRAEDMARRAETMAAMLGMDWLATKIKGLPL